MRPSGANHYAWIDGPVAAQTGRARALKKYPRIGPCELCGNPKSERHHRDGDATNNETGNVQPLCRRCHMKVDGRLEAVRRRAKKNQRRASEASRVAGGR